MTDHRQRSAEQIFEEQAVTFVKTGENVQVMCNSPEDAEVLFDWLMQQVVAPQTKPPFEDRCRVRATRDTRQNSMAMSVWKGMRTGYEPVCGMRSAGGWFRLEKASLGLMRSSWPSLLYRVIRPRFKMALR